MVSELGVYLLNLLQRRGGSTVGRLLRYQQILLDDVENATEEAIAQALDELSER